MTVAGADLGEATEKEITSTDWGIAKLSCPGRVTEGGGCRVSVASWQIVTEPDLKGETEQVALSQGYRFYESLLGVDADTMSTS